MKIHVVGAELFHAGGRAGGRADGRTDGRTDRQTDTEYIQAYSHDEVISRLWQFCERP